MNNSNYRRPSQKNKHQKRRLPIFNIVVIILLLAIICAVVLLTIGDKFSNRLDKETVSLTSQSQDTLDANQTESDINTINPLSYTEITLLNAGDVMYHSPQIEQAYNSSTGVYDFSDTYQYIKSVISSADFSAVNFETTLAGPDYEYSGYPTFNTPDTGLTALIDAGFDMMLFANNHCYDKMLDGVIRTQQMFNQYGIQYVGARLDKEEKTYKNVTVDGITLGMLNSTDDLSYGNTSQRTVNGISVRDGDLEYLDVFNLSLLDDFYSNAEERINELRNNGANIIIYYIHWGDEYHLEHNENQEKIAQKLCDLGVDVIIGGHPHVVQDAEILKSSTNPEHQTLCFYSLGNFVSNQNRLTMGDTINKEYTENGLMVKLTIRKYYNGDCLVTGVETIPTWVHRYYDYNKQKNCHVIVPLPAANENPEAFGLTLSDFGVANAQNAYQMTNATLNGICEAFAQSVVLPVEDE